MGFDMYTCTMAQNDRDNVCVIQSDQRLPEYTSRCPYFTARGAYDVHCTLAHNDRDIVYWLGPTNTT